MLRYSWRRVLDRLRALKRPGLSELAFVGVGLTCLLLPQWWALSRNESQRRQEVRDALRTTVDTTEARIASWVSERRRRAREVVRSQPFMDRLAEAVAGDGKDPQRLQALGALIAEPGGNEYVVYDDQGSPLIASQPSELDRFLSPEVRVAATGGGAFVPWDLEPWRAALVVSLDPSSAPAAFLATPIATRAGLAEVIDERALGKTGRTSLFIQGGGWIVDSSGAMPPDCARSPSDVISSASERGGGAMGGAWFNLDGYLNCRGEEVVGVWETNDDIGVGLLTEIALGEAYGSLTSSRLSFIAFGILAGGLLLVLVSLQTSAASAPGDRTPRRSRSSAAWGILGVALLATVIAWLSARSRYVDFEEDRFRSAVERVHGKLAHRLDHQLTALLAVRGAIDVFPQMSAAQRERFLTGIGLNSDFSSFTCLSLLEDVESDPKLAPSSTCLVKSDGLNPLACSVCTDSSTLPVLVEAARAAIATGQPAASILPPSSGRGSVLVALATPPVGEDPLQTVPVGIIDVADLGRGLTRSPNSWVEVELYGSTERNDGALLYRSTRERSPDAQSDKTQPVRRTLEFGGKQWALVAWPAESVAPPITENYPAQVLLAGLAISVLLFDIALVLSSTRSRALAIAELMTQRLRDGEVRIRAVIESAPDGIVSFDRDGAIGTFNPGAEKLFGYSAEEVGEKRIDDLLPDLDLDEGRIFQQLDRKGVRADGEVFPAELTVSRMEIEDRLSFIAIVRDVSARYEAQERLKESEERYALAARGANDGLWDWNLKTNSIYYSTRWRGMIGLDDDLSSNPEEWLGRVHSEDVVNLRRRLADHLEGRVPHFECEYRIQHVNGGYRWMLTRGIAVRDDDGSATRIAGSQTDITERKRAERQLLYDALHDPLTGLPNRTYFMGRVDQARLEATRSSNRMFGLLFLDIDRFKVVNDSLGHYIGDQLLVAVSERLKSCLRPGDTICRLGGDEFAVLVEKLDGVQAATRVAERIQRELERPLRLGERELYAAVSIGIVLSSTGKRTAEELLRDADLAMYRAKSRGRARYELFTQGLHTRAVELLQVETDLRHAVERDELVLHYQPIVDLRNGAIESCEALIRWNHPQRGLLSPGEFIGVAEESGAIIQMTRWLLEAACRQRRAWMDEGLPPMRISVNISPRQLQQQDIYELVTQTLNATGQPPEALQLELTESALMESADSTVSPLKELSERGVRVALDDFGTGYSSLIYLRRFPIHNIKIDRSFVRSIPYDAGNAAIASGLVALAHGLNLKVVAEGVETLEQLRFLRRKGCDEIQGFAVSRPLPADEFAQLVQCKIDLEASDTALIVRHPIAL